MNTRKVWLLNWPKEGVDELEEEIEDYDALLETQLDDMYESWKTRKDAHDKEAQIRLSQEKGLPARKKKERQQLAELFDEELDATKAEYSNMMKQNVWNEREWAIS